MGRLQVFATIPIPNRGKDIEMKLFQIGSTIKITRLLALAITLPLSGCIATGDPFGLNSLNDSAAVLLGTYQAPTLAAYPIPSECGSRDERCRALDQTEAYLYQEARARRILWVQLVDRFYTERAKLYPNTNDNHGAREWFSFQRMLAEQMDLKKITETQWVYLHEKKRLEMNSRARQDAANEAIINQQRQANQPQIKKEQVQNPRNCWTTKSGSSYYTTCN